MGRIFISHSSKDNSIALSFKTKLEEQGYSGIFLDFDPMVGIPAGRDWERELYTNLKGCAAVIFLCSEYSIASRWCFAEITQARALDKAIFPIKISDKISDCKMDGLLTDVQVIDMTLMGESEAYQRLWRGFQVSGPNNLFDWKGDRSPYPGLLAFDQEDAAVFFGRDFDIQKGLESLRKFWDFGGSRFLVLLGPSGCGKSSLMRAGLLPRLPRDKRLWVVVDPFRPKDDPFGELGKAFAATFQRYGQTRDSSELSIKIRQEDTLLQLANELKEALGQRDARVVLPIDQMEELLNPTLGDTASLFMQVLQGSLVAKESPLMVIGTLRSDFLGDFQLHQAFKTLDYEPLHIKLMEDEQIEQVITEPARVAGLELEAGLVQKIIKDMEGPEALPLMAYTLREFWEQYGRDGKLTLVAYKQLGGLKGSIGRAAAAVLDGYVSPKDPLRSQVEEYLRLAFFKMVRIGEAGKSLRKIAVWSDMPLEVHEVLERFVEKRLLTSGENKSLEVSHEALFVEWPLLLQWINDKKSDLLERQRIEDSAKAWNTGKRLYEYLLEGKLLNEADSFLETKSQELPLSNLAQEFINQSHKKGDLLKLQSIEEAANQWQASGKPLEGTPLSEAKVFLKKKAQEFPLSPLAKDFINQSLRRRFTNRLKLASIFLLPIVGVAIWWNTPSGQLTQIRWRLTDLSQQVSDEFRFKAVAAFAKDENFDQAIAGANQIKDSSYKVYALVAIAKIYGKLNQTDKAAPLLDKAIAAANQIKESHYKADALGAIAVAIGKLNQPDKAAPLLDKAIAAANQIHDSSDKDYTLGAIAQAIAEAIFEAHGKLDQPEKAIPLLDKAIAAANQIKESHYKADALGTIAQAIGKLDQPEKAAPLLDKAIAAANQIQDPHYRVDALYDKAYALCAIAEAYGKLNQPEKAAPLLDKTIDTVNQIQDSYYNQIQDPYYKAEALNGIAIYKAKALYAIAEAIFEAYGKLNQPDKAAPLLDKATAAANQIKDSYNKAYALRAIAEAYGMLNQSDKAAPLLDKAIAAANQIKDSYNKADALYYKAEAISAIARAYGMLNQPDKAAPLLDKAIAAANQIQDPHDKAKALSAIAVAIGKLNQPDKAVSLLDKTIAAANQIQDPHDKADALGAIAQAIVEAIGKLNQPDKAALLLDKAIAAANQIQDPHDKAAALHYKAYALCAIAEAIGKLDQPDKAAPLLDKAIVAVNQIQNLYENEIKSSSEKAEALSAIALAIGKLNQPDKAAPLLDKAIAAANQIKDLKYKANALRDITEADANLKSWGYALEVVQYCPSKDCEVDLLAKILTINAEQQHPELKEEEKEEK